MLIGGMWMRDALFAFIFGVDTPIRDHYQAYYTFKEKFGTKTMTGPMLLLFIFCVGSPPNNEHSKAPNWWSETDKKKIVDKVTELAWKTPQRLGLLQSEDTTTVRTNEWETLKAEVELLAVSNSQSFCKYAFLVRGSESARAFTAGEEAYIYWEFHCKSGVNDRAIEHVATVFATTIFSNAQSTHPSAHCLIFEIESDRETTRRYVTFDMVTDSVVSGPNISVTHPNPSQERRQKLAKLYDDLRVLKSSLKVLALQSKDKTSELPKPEDLNKLMDEWYSLYRQLGYAVDGEFHILKPKIKAGNTR